MCLALLESLCKAAYLFWQVYRTKNHSQFLKVAVQPCQARALGVRVIKPSVYLMTTNWITCTRKPQDCHLNCDNEIHNSLVVASAHKGCPPCENPKSREQNLWSEPNKQQTIPHAWAFAATYGKAEVQKNTRAIIILDMLGALQEQIFSAIAPSLHGKRASIRRRK